MMEASNQARPSRQVFGNFIRAEWFHCGSLRLGASPSSEGGAMDERISPAAKAQFGVPGLDDILLGGLTRNRLYLIEGAPGSGKTTLGLQFLLEGARVGEKGL